MFQTASLDQIAVANDGINTIGFPGLGWVFNIKETAIENLFGIEGFNIQWYGIILALGICAAFLLFYRNATKKESIDADTVFNITLLIVPIAIIGARFFYVVTSWDKYKDRSFFDMINIREGGIAIYGAIIFAIITLLIYSKVSKKPLLPILDALAPGVMLGQIIGRWGNFVNAEAYGLSEGVENLPWRMWLEQVHLDGKLQRGVHLVHPTFLYESLWNAIGLVLIMTLLYKGSKKKFNGEIFCAYMGWYGLGRAIIECFRADSLYIFGGLKFSVFVGIVAFAGAIALGIFLYKKSKTQTAHTDATEESPEIPETPEDSEELTAEESQALAEAALLDGNIEDFEEFENEEEQE